MVGAFPLRSSAPVLWHHNVYSANVIFFMTTGVAVVGFATGGGAVACVAAVSTALAGATAGGGAAAFATTVGAALA
eukprot:2124092-Lingulodinium_polyedra.AAC.1